MCKESWRSKLEKEEEDKYIKELEENPKAKKSKITNADIESYTELELI